MILTGLVLGVILGAVMQRGRFCVTGMLRDITLQHTFRPIVNLFIVIAISAVGFATLTSAGIITPEYDPFAPVAVIAGSLIFGIGIVLAGGCASGTWYRSGEGLVGSWFALIFYAAFAAAMKYGALQPVNSTVRGWTVPLTTINATLGLSVWWFVVPFAVATAAAAIYYTVTQRANYWAAYAIGILAVLAWPLSAATGRNDGLGITTPSANTVRALTGQGSVDWGVLLVLGILIGSFIAAIATGEFRVRVPDGKQAVKSVIGGAFMGIGAALAGGCTVGNGMVQTSLFTYQGWFALAFTFVGVTIATKLWIKPTKAAHAVTPATTTTSTAPAFATATGLLSAPLAGASGSGQLTEVADRVYTLDTLGAVCPFPLVDAKATIATLSPGDSLRIDFDCTQATQTIPQWAKEEGLEITDFHPTGRAAWQITLTIPENATMPV